MNEFEFWITITGILSGVVGLTIRTLLKSKCDKVDCFCLKIHRNTEQEHDEPISRTPSSNPRDVLYSV